MITGLEMEMISTIRARFPSDANWLALLSGERVADLNDRPIRRTRGYMGGYLLFTQFSDKTMIIRKSKLLGDSVSGATKRLENSVEDAELAPSNETIIKCLRRWRSLSARVK